MIVSNAKTSMESNVPLNQIKKFGVDADNMELIMEILSKLYAYPIRTMVQEYICNGRDAMREAGTWGKIPMTIGLPNTLEPTFRVRDYGVGISPDRMDNVFVNYGSSTKRDSNTQTGGFGIGSKSFRCYTDSMSVVSFHNGTKYTYVVQPAGCLLLSKESTKELNGVEIQIAVKHKDISDFFDAVQRCVRFWTEEIKFEGAGADCCKQLLPTFTLGNLTCYDNQGVNGRTIYLIDGIEYDLIVKESRPYWMRNEKNLHSTGSIVAINVPNGYFKIASSRERLEDNDKNEELQTQLLSKCTKSIESLMSREINNTARSLQERLQKKAEYSGLASVASAHIQIDKDHKLSGSTLYLSNRNVDTRYTRRVRRGSKMVFEIGKTNSLLISRVVIVDTSGDSNPGTLARRLNHWLSSNTDKELVIEAPSKIPFCSEIFSTILKSEKLPLPPKNTTPKPPKSDRQSFVYSLHSDGGSSQVTVRDFNSSSLVSVIVDEVTPEALELSKFTNVYRIPKCNKDMITKKCLTIDEGIKWLLKSNKETTLIGVTGVSTSVQKLPVMKDIVFTAGASIDLIEFLESKEPSIKTKRRANKELYDNLLAKYPLIKVLDSMFAQSREHIKILVDEINKQSKDV
jgi:hypothetical protein